jgi:hypothetical protein
MRRKWYLWSDQPMRKKGIFCMSDDASLMVGNFVGTLRLVL